MLRNTPPATWDTSGQITPEKLNRNMLAAADQLEDYSSAQWRRFNTEITLNPINKSVSLPSITGVSYVIERITISGSYTGDPVLIFGPSGFQEQFTLPVGPVTSYIGTVLPGYLVTGNDWVTNYIIDIDGTGVFSELHMLLGIRVSRNPTGSPSVWSSTLATWEDGDVLTAAAFNAQISALSAYSAEWIAADAPKNIDVCTFTGIKSTDALTVRQSSSPGSGDCTVTRILGTIKLDSVGVGLQSVTVSYGFGGVTASFAVSVAGLTSVTFTSGTIALTETARDPASSSDDWVIQITNSVGGTELAHVVVYTVNNR